MLYALKKIHIALTLLLLTTVSRVQVYGDFDQSSTWKECTSSCACVPVCCGKGFISIELLYWRAFEDGLDDCFPVENFDYVFSDGEVISRFKGKGKDLHFNWDAGFRLGTGYRFACDWDIGVYWTDFHSRSSTHHKNEYGFRDEHKIRWRLDFEVVDVILGRELDLGSCFTFKPFVGVRGARIKQRLHAKLISQDDSYLDYNSSVFFPDSSSYIYSSFFTTSSEHHKQRFLGIGPLIGLNANLDLKCGFSIYANAAVGFLYGHFHIRSKESDEFLDGAEYCYVRRHLHACQTVFDAGLGIRWETCFCGDIVWFQLGLEHHSYFNQNRLTNYGDLCLDGATFSVGIEF